MQRVAILLYALVAYAGFLVTILYAIGFVANLLVPKSVDSGPAGPRAQAIWMNVGLLALFAIQHTIMARPAFKQWWTQIIPPAAERSTFVLVSNLLLGLLFWQWRPIPAVVWDVQSDVGAAALVAVSFLGWTIVFYSSLLIDHFGLFGLRQSYRHLRGQAYPDRPFVVRSLYHVVRHPLMLGFLLAFWSTPRMTQGHLLFAAVTTAYIVFGTRMEERDLIRHHGNRYRQYRRSTPMLIPWPRGRRGEAADAS